MTVIKAASALSPLGFQSLSPIFSDDVTEIIEQLNYSYAEFQQPLIAVNVTGEGSADFNPHSDRGVLSLGNPEYSCLVYVPDEYVSLTLGMSVLLGVSGTVQCAYNVGSDSGNLNVSSDFSEGTVSIETSSSGTGWLLCDFSFTRTAGTGPHYVTSLRLQVESVGVSDIPSPPSGDF